MNNIEIINETIVRQVNLEIIDKSTGGGFLKNKFFKKEVAETTDQLESRIRTSRKTSSGEVANRDSDPKLVVHTGGYKITGAHIKEELIIPQEEIFMHSFSGNIYDKTNTLRIIELIKEKSNILRDRIDVKLERLATDFLFNKGVIRYEKSKNMEFPREAKFNLTPPDSWSDVSADIKSDLRKAKIDLRKSGSLDPNLLICSNATYEDFEKNTGMMELLDKNNYNAALFDPKKYGIQKNIATSYQFYKEFGTIISYNEHWDNTPTTQVSFLNDFPNQLVYLDSEEQLGYFSFGPIIDGRNVLKTKFNIKLIQNEYNQIKLYIECHPKIVGINNGYNKFLHFTNV